MACIFRSNSKAKQQFMAKQLSDKEMSVSAQMGRDDEETGPTAGAKIHHSRAEEPRASR